MAKKKENEQEGVWRTIGGRRVFIKKGQSLSDAMKESGKFKKVSDVKRGEYQELNDKIERTNNFNKATKYISKGDMHNATPYMNAYLEYEDRITDRKKQEAYTGDMTNEVWAGKHVEGGPNSYKEKAENEAEKYYSKLSQYQAREDLDMRKSWLDDNVYAPDKRKEYEEFYKQGEEYYNKKYGTPIKEKEKIDKKISDEIESSIKSLYIYQDEKNMGSMSLEPLKKYYDKYGKENVDKVWKDMDKKYVVAKGTNVDYEGLHYNNLLNRDDYPKEALDKYISSLNSLRESGLGYSQPREYNEKSRNLMSELERSKISIQDVSPMSEWSDTTGTGFSDLQSTTLKNRYKGTYEYLKNTKNMNGVDILELLKKIDEDKK